MNCSIEVSTGSEEMDSKKEARPGAVEPETGAIFRRITDLFSQ
jgi:hypothetical protein